MTMLAGLVLCACQGGGITPAAGEAPASAQPAGGSAREAADTVFTGEMPGHPIWETRCTIRRGTGTDAGGDGFGLAGPRELINHGGSAIQSRVVNAAEYDDALTHHSVARDGDSAVFDPLWDADGGTPHNLGLAVYRVALVDFQGDSLATLKWSVEPENTGDAWIGVGNLVEDRWDWARASNPDIVDLPSLIPCIAANGDILFAIVVLGQGESTLDWIRIGAPQAPVADIAATPDSGRAPLETSLSAAGSSDADGTIVRYEWDINEDGAFELDTELTATVSHEYAEPGIYYPMVRVTDDDGLIDQEIVEVHVTSTFNQAPVADLTGGPLTGTPPQLVTFDASGSYDPDGEISTYEWDWDGDGTYEQLTITAETSHTYGSSGAFNTTVRVTDNEFATATASIEVRLAADPEAALTVSPNDGNAPLGLNFDASGSVVPGGSIAGYDWDFEGDGIWDASTVVPYAQIGMIDEGVYDSAVLVTSAMGATDGAVADPPVTIRGFSRSFGGSSFDWFNAVASDGTGAIIGAGSTLSYGAGSYDGLIIKLTTDGDLTWARTWGGGYTDDLMDTVADALGNIYITGYTQSFAPGGERDAFIAKLSPSGSHDWTRTWGRENNDWFNDMALDNIGGVVCAGETVNEEYSSMEDILVVKHDLNGNLQWARTYSCGRGDSYPFVTCSDTGEIIVTGRSVIPLYGIQASLIRISPDGDLISQQHWGGSHQDGFYRSVFIDGDLYLTGFTKSFGDSEGDALLVKVNPAGQVEWARAWGTDQGETLTAIHLGADGLLYCCGIHATETSGDYGILLKYTTGGEFLGAQRLDTTGVTRIWDGMSVGGGTFVLAGSTFNAYGTWTDIEGIMSGASLQFEDIEGTLSDAGGTAGQHIASVNTVSGLTANTGGGELDCLAVAFRTPAE